MPPEDPPVNVAGEPPGRDVTPVNIEDEMRSSYLDYAMSVIVSRALPDVRDGLKPVHRRIVYAMKEGGYDYNRPFRKSARIVGDVMGKYHPHGDAAIYDAMVRMAQGFAMRLALIQGQGNFGSMDGDRAAAMRYTEARLARSAHSLIEDIDKDTVDFTSNYDDSGQEPSVLPAQFPNLLVNGAGGIAVGMATNIPPHNLGEVINACCAVIDDPAISINDLIEYHIFGPDFPTGGLILGRQGLHAAFHTGRGSITLRGRTAIESFGKDREAIIVTEVPYQVNKARMIEIIAEAVRDKKIEGISDLRDESDRDGVRVVIEVKRDTMAEVVLNQLYKFSPLQTSFGVNMLALNGGRPEQLNLKQVLQAFIDFREEVITRRTAFELGKARERAHTLAGLAIAVENLDPVIELIRGAKDAADAREKLMAKPWPAGNVVPLIELIDDPTHPVVKDKYELSEEQAKAILELRLHRLTGLERDKIAEDLQDVCAKIQEYLEILASKELLFKILREELIAMREQFADERRTTIEEGEFEHDIEDLIQREDMVVTVSDGGYIKRVPASAYRAQHRGGKGRAGMATRDEDFVANVFIANTHQPVLFFSSSGMVYKLKVYKLPQGTPQARGKAMVNLLPLDEGETITTVMPLPEDETGWDELFAVFTTASGRVRRNRLSDFTNVMANGKIAMKFENGHGADRLIRVRIFAEDEDVFLATRDGKCIRFPVTDVRVFAGRSSTGVRGIRLADDDTVIFMAGLRHIQTEVEARDDYLRAVNAKRRLAGGDYTDRDEDLAHDSTLAERLAEPRFHEMMEEEQFILTVTEDGFGKRSSAYDYRISKRGGKGIDSIDLKRGKDRTQVVATVPVIETDEMVMVSDGGQLIRMPVDGISFTGRTARGVTLFRVGEEERVVSVTRLRDFGEEGEDHTGESHGEESE
ncbi:MAG: DNA gyrase subunit A [Pseudomonadota bacterium]|nr:DNA gyrase subunit A [Pseudomonadota bacterium]